MSATEHLTHGDQGCKQDMRGCTLLWCGTCLVTEEELPYWHLEHEVLLAEAKANIGNSAVEEAGGSEHQDQVEVPRKGSLEEGKRGSLSGWWRCRRRGEFRSLTQIYSVVQRTAGLQTKDYFHLMIFLIHLSVIWAMKCQKMVRNVGVDILKCLVLSATQRRIKKPKNIPI